MLRQYLLFAWRQYAPEGGWGDLREKHETLEAAEAAGRALVAASDWDHSFFHVVDLKTLSVVAEGEREGL
jgi:hypothetical protein